MKRVPPSFLVHIPVALITHPQLDALRSVALWTLDLGLLLTVPFTWNDFQKYGLVSREIEFICLELEVD